MKTSISAGSYFSHDAFEQEKKRLFSKVWTFVGLKRNLQNHHDFITRSIAGVPIVVQSFHGELRAFVNVCSHRFSQIHSEELGNRPLQCPYHGWAYNSEGMPVGIPDRPRFDDMTPAKLCELKLTRWNVDVVGDLVFVSAPDVTQSLQEYLGLAFERVLTWANAFGALADVIDVVFDSNWKIAVENTLESYHVPSVHPVSFSWLSRQPGVNRIEDRHSSFSRGVTEQTAKGFGKLSRLFDKRPVKILDYQHQFVFPNLTLATTFGTTFSLQLFEPLAPNRTRFTSFVFSTILDSRDAVASWLEEYCKGVVQFNSRVFAEDKIACERVQQGVVGATTAGILSDEESRVAAFQNQYQTQMS